MKILFVFAHPDDETIVAGGTCVLLSKGHDVVLFCATKGEAGLVGNPAVTTQEKLGSVRQKELERAAKILGISKITFLGFIDGTLENHKTQITNAVFKNIKKEKPDVVITFNNQGGWSAHPDHKAISECATQAFQKYAKTEKKKLKLYHSAIPEGEVKRVMPYVYSFGKIKATPDECVTTIVDVSKSLKTKLEALAEHKTQHKDYERLYPYLSKTNKEFFSLIFENSVA
jgi:N-acetylglucosamine malate deacetylase 2